MASLDCHFTENKKTLEHKCIIQILLFYFLPFIYFGGALHGKPIIAEHIGQGGA
jgi:hypothetical protein